MKSNLIASSLLAASAVTARPLLRREVPQEHSHEQFLTTVRASLQANNPDQISDPVFGLLGNAAAAAGQGKITNTDCLQQATADQAFTNAKAAGDVAGMTAALIYRALERNTGKVGLASTACTAIKATNPEIAAISQHQDPASDGAAATNKKIVLELAKQIQSVGGDPQNALKSGTFKPGRAGDPTAKGNSCDDANDKVGCIFTQKLIVEDATAAEVAAAAGGSASNATADTATASNSTAAAASSAPQVDSKAVAGTSAVSNDTATTAISNDNTTAAASTAAAGNVDLGSCTDPAIIFGVGFDGRKEASFQPDDKTEFAHDSAQDPGVVASFICDRLNDKCKASAATISACRTVAAQIKGKKNDPNAAVTFNNVFGVQPKQAIDTSAGSGSAAVAKVAAGQAGGVAPAAKQDKAMQKQAAASQVQAAGGQAGKKGPAGDVVTIEITKAAKKAMKKAVKKTKKKVTKKKTKKTNKKAKKTKKHKKHKNKANKNQAAAQNKTQNQAAQVNAQQAPAQAATGASASNTQMQGQNQAVAAQDKAVAANATQNEAGNAQATAAAAAATSASAGAGNGTAASGGLDLGSCPDPAIGFGIGFDGRKEASFEPDDKTTFTHGSAQDPAVVAQSICDQMSQKCGASAAAISACRAAATAIKGKKNDPNAAVTFNNALGVQAKNIGIDTSAGSAGASGNNKQQGNGNSSAGNNKVATTGTNGSNAAGSTSGSSTDFGGCTDPTIKFAVGLDGRKDPAFEPNNEADFNHGSALNIPVITSFICGQLGSKCKASAAAVSKCQAAASKANALKGQAAADAFNSAITA